MKPKVLSLLLVAMLLPGAGLAASKAKTPAGPVSDPDLARQISHKILVYPFYSIWDDISFRVHDGQVQLLGAVSQPQKKTDIERLVGRTPGVTSVTNEIKVLPFSTNDDQVRVAVANAIFHDASLGRYFMSANPSIHIIVDGGHVTLTGFVDSDFDKNQAGILARGAGLNFGVTNNLEVMTSPKKG